MNYHTAPHALRRAAAVLVPVLTLAAASPIEAALIYWDLNGVTPGAGAAPSGTWDASATNWNTDPGGEGAGPGAWIPGETAVFSAGTDAISEYTVSISGTQQTGGVIVKDGIVAFAGGAAAIGANTLTVTNNATLSIDSTLRISASQGAKAILDGGTIRQTNPSNAGSFISSLINLEIGPNGGTVNYTSSGVGTVSTYGGATDTSATIVGSGVLTKTGPHEFRYQGAGLPNTTYSKLIVKEGLFRLGFSQSTQDERGFGAVPTTFTPDQITLDGGTIGTSFTVTLHANRGITLGPGGGTVNTGGASMTIPGAITGPGSLTKTHTGSNAQSLTLSGDNTYTGVTFVNTGFVAINHANALGSADAGTIVAAGAELRVSGATNTFTTNEPILISGAGASGGGAIAVLNSAAPTFTGGVVLQTDAAVAVSSGASATFTDFTSDGNQSLTLKGTSTVGGTITGPIVLNNGGLTKEEAGTWTIGGAATYAGVTTVTTGRLVVAGSITGTAEVNVSGTLAGTGNIAPSVFGNLNVRTGGKLAPGVAAAGNLTVTLNLGQMDLVEAVTPANSQTLLFDLDVPSTSDRITTLGGTLEIGVGVLEFDDFAFTPLAGFNPGEGADYLLFDGALPISGTLGPNVTGTIGGFAAELQFADGGRDLILHVVPEPGSAALLLGGLSLLARRRRLA